ncbi:MAG: hypothetical protein AB7F74_03830 [Parvibaculaceae bacterium]
MLGKLIASLDDPKVAMGLLAALDEPALLTRLAVAAAASGRLPADIVGSAVRNFMETAPDDLWTQLVGIMNRADNPGLAAIGTILDKALPQGPGTQEACHADR